jgi:glycosyltransferase involved in cell wall biosynthesis
LNKTEDIKNIVKSSNYPEVSVVLCTYNREKTLAGSVKSVLDQTFCNFELIIVDDNSSDNSKDLINSFNDPRIIYLKHDTNRGPAISRNTGIKTSRGNYICFQDSDDQWFPDKLQKQLEAFSQNKTSSVKTLGVVSTGYWKIFGSKKYYAPTSRAIQREGDLFETLLYGNVIAIHSLVLKEVFDKIGFFDESLPALEDWELWLRISKTYSFKLVDEALVNVPFGPQTISSSYTRMLTALEIILKKHLNDFKKYPAALARRYLSIGNAYILNGDIQKGREYLKKAISMNKKFEFSSLKPTILIPTISAVGLFAFSFIGQKAYTGVFEFGKKLRENFL